VVSETTNSTILTSLVIVRENDDGAIFSCQAVQFLTEDVAAENPPADADAATGEPLFETVDELSPLVVVLPPTTMGRGGRSEEVFFQANDSQTLELTFSFRAKPLPDNIKWTVTTNGLTEAEDVVVLGPGQDVQGFTASRVIPTLSIGETESGDGRPHSFQAKLYVSNLTSDANITASVTSPHLKRPLEKAFYVNFVPPPSYENEEAEVDEAGVNWLLVGITMAVLLLVLLVVCALFCCATFRRTSVERRRKASGVEKVDLDRVASAQLLGDAREGPANSEQ